MLPRLLALALAALLAACTTVSGPPDNPRAIRAMTYNIRLDLASDGPNAWPHRKEMVAEIIRHEAPDIFGLQEVLLHQKRDLEAALPAYVLAGAGRDDGLEAGEFSPVGWRRDRYEALDSGTFWLSPTPAVPGKAWDAAYPRVASWVLLQDRASGQRLRVLNTHFDHVGAAARIESARLVMAWARDPRYAGVPAIILGDFNSVPSSASMMLLADHAQSGLRLASAASAMPPYGPPGTFNGFKIDAADAAPIDHIFVSDGLTVMRHATLTQHWEGRLPSDHYPVVAELLVAPASRQAVPATPR